MINEENQAYELLKKKVERTIGFRPQSPREFTRLERDIYASTRQLISTSTLKRFWGYNGEKYNVKPTRTTLNILSGYVGFVSWDMFCNSDSVVKESSGYILNDVLHSRSLQIGDVVRLMWNPNRCVEARFDGMDMFTVLKSQNSKIQQGDTFICPYIIKGEPLNITHLVHAGNPPVNYSCGKDGGVFFTVLKSSR